MSTFTWITGNDQWTDPDAWDLDGAPGPNDVASFAGVTATVLGYGYVGTISIDLTQLSFDGFFETDPNGISLLDQSALSDISGDASSYNSLIIGYTSVLSVGQVSLGDSTVVDQGGFSAAGGDVQSLEVSGPEGAASIGVTLAVSTLSVLSGGSVAGDLLLAAGGLLMLDDQSMISQGLIEVQGKDVLALDLTQIGSPGTVSFADAIQLDSGATLTVVAPPNCTLDLAGSVSGEGTLALQGTSLDVQSGATIDATVTDGGLSLGEGLGGGGDGGNVALNTVSISSDATLLSGQISLLSTTIEDSGTVDLAGGALDGLMVSGSDASAAVTGSLVVATLSIASGGTFSGTIVLSDGSTLTLDDLSTINAGAIVVTGDASLFLGPDSVGGSSSYSIDDAISIQAGATLAISGRTGSVLALDQSISGAGTLLIEGTTVDLTSGGTISVATLASSGTLALAGPASGGGATHGSEGTNEDVYCVSGSDNVQAGSSPIIVVGAGASAIDFRGGTGSANLSPGGAILNATLGTGASTVSGGSSGEDSVVCGFGPSVIYGSAGMAVSVDGSAATTVHAGSGSETINGSLSSGDNVYYGGGSGSTDCVTGGTGNDIIVGYGANLDAVCGSGTEAVWGADGADTIVGGTGNDILAGGTNALVYAKGSGDDIVIAAGDGGLYDLSASSGTIAFFGAFGTTMTTIIGGSGNEIFDGGSAPISLQGHSGNLTFWSAAEETVLLDFAGGSNIADANVGADLKVQGAGNNVFVSLSPGDNVIDCSGSTGNNEMYGGSTGITTMYGGSGSDTMVGEAAPIYAIGGSGDEVIWDGPTGHSTIEGGSGQNFLLGSDDSILMAPGSGTNDLYAAGSNVTLQGGTNGGSDLFWMGPNETACTIDIYSGNSTVDGSKGTFVLTIDDGDVVINSGTGRETIYVNSDALSSSLQIYHYAASTCTLIDVVTKLAVPGTGMSLQGMQVIHDGHLTITLHS